MRLSCIYIWWEGNKWKFTTIYNCFQRTLADFYGFNLAVNFSSLKYGASGSMVYNEFTN
ncbi:DUF31 family putative serine protease [Mycoplasmopsis cynos]|uniref:DUF31 family putative serine protease n=1 Tax=Mycoplasmopsis cynos TaxID=171284 RepID=UPI003A5C888A